MKRKKIKREELTNALKTIRQWMEIGEAPQTEDDAPFYSEIRQSWAKTIIEMEDFVQNG